MNNGNRTDGNRTDGNRTNENRTNENRTNENRTNGNRTNGNRTNGNRGPGLNEPFISKFHRFSTNLFKINIAFIMLFIAVYHIIIPAIALVKGVVDPNAGPFDIFIGIGLFSLLFIIYNIAHTRIGAFLVALTLAYWWFIPSNWIINDESLIAYGYGMVYYIFRIIWLITALITILGWFNVITNTINLKKNNHSILLGLWFSRFADLKNKEEAKKIIQAHKKQIRKAAIAIPVLIAISLSGTLSYLDAYSFRVKVTPGDYDVTFNFWATPGINENYTQDMQQKYGLGVPLYSDAVKAQLNKHKVNLDLTFGSFDYKNVETLKEWEAQLPNITYRIVLSPGNLSDLAYKVFHATDILMECERNGTLDQWIGFCFDIEGDPFNYRSSFDSFEQATGMWNTIFDFIDKRSELRGKTIEMECVSDFWLSPDVKFDSDTDIHQTRGFNEYYPERFTSYAPMIYRCWYKGELPFGSPEESDDPWPTSYEVYSSIYTLASALPPEKVGVYLGITNCSCYGRDLPQNEPYTWPTDETNTGLTNLLRDVLIAKSFGIKEVTFFLLWTAIENNYSMAGVFDAYGDDFLDVVNTTVNTNPPESFDIFFKYSDARNSDVFQKDWVYDFKKPRGLFELTLIVVLSFAVVYKDKLKNYRTNKKKIDLVVYNF